MKKYILALPILALVIPPVGYRISNANPVIWTMLILIAGFLGVLTLFIKTNWFVRLVAIGSFINCFFSTIPDTSFTSYFFVLASCYYYILLTKLKDWSFIFKCLWAVVILNCLFMILQIFKIDCLLNTPGQEIQCFQLIGYHMQTASYSVVMSALLIQFQPLIILFSFATSIFCGSQWGLLCSGIGLAGIISTVSKKWVVYAGVICILILLFFSHKISANISGHSGRVHCWVETLKATTLRPLTGWGIGVFKNVDMKLCGDKYAVVHNDYIQYLFENGILGLIIMLSAMYYFFKRLFKAKNKLAFTGAVMIALNMLVHFPMQMFSVMVLIILFLAYNNEVINGQ